MRRAQGPDGAISASRAAYIGGCESTSNTLAGKLFDIPVRGTHAHSWVSAFANEMEAFTAYASVMPDNCVLLVDTFNTIEGIKNAINVGKKLRALGGELLGIRLDSGDMVALSNQARKLLDEAGFEKTHILASNSLDEYTISDLKQKGAKITVWGVGTKLATAYDTPALDGVYKLCAIRADDVNWEYKLKLSEDEIKISNPGRQQIRRFFYNDQYVLDVIYDLDIGITDNPDIILLDKTQQIKKLDDYDGYADLLQPIMQNGKLVQKQESIHHLRHEAITAREHFYRTHGDKVYPVALEKKLYDLKQRLIKELSIKK
jgi:nicotinate phosphoribosyltransferase